MQIALLAKQLVLHALPKKKLLHALEAAASVCLLLLPLLLARTINEQLVILQACHVVVDMYWSNIYYYTIL